MERAAEQGEAHEPVADVAPAARVSLPPAVERVVTLQRTIGNRAVGRVLARQPGAGGGAGGTPKLAKHVVVDVNDGYADVWSKQWIAAQPHARERVTMSKGADAAAAIAAYKAAITKAGAGGRIVVNVGHGGTAGGDVDGFVDLSPKSRAFRIGGLNVADTFVSVFYDFDPDGPGPSMSDQQSDVKYSPGSKRAKNWGVYQDLCKAFRAGNIDRVILLTCKVGNSSTFIRKIANDWGTVVVAYKDRMVLDPQPPDKKGHQRIRMRLEHDSPGRGTNIPESEEHVPLPTESNSVAAGPPLGARGGKTAMDETSADAGTAIASAESLPESDAAVA